jgi:hypothetical protein
MNAHTKRRQYPTNRLLKGLWKDWKNLRKPEAKRWCDEWVGEVSAFCPEGVPFVKTTLQDCRISLAVSFLSLSSSVCLGKRIIWQANTTGCETVLAFFGGAAFVLTLQCISCTSRLFLLFLAILDTSGYLGTLEYIIPMPDSLSPNCRCVHKVNGSLNLPGFHPNVRNTYTSFRLEKTTGRLDYFGSGYVRFACLASSA